ncbi:RNA polymerase sigma factor [Sphingobacterium bovistauri]|uniref:Sigma-70 family RNA polymerase sigma factor n=1 Tax=Sphingobacterium bovistauri TaxID=2781959 RepID=A0ABS7Z621_9SPHI|nr:sigma-70 family RNA polymerase sigma factor [Sphingobacterium bovistauri]MCA5005027.1 sigma-70 family RNA polymerase sigma factor [Sphingobacterium bovistauri]
MKKEDILIIDGINQENPIAFKRLFDRFWFKIYRMAIQKLPSEEDASDITQEVFYLIWKNRKFIRVKSNLDSYLISMLRHKIYDFYAKRDRLPILVSMIDEEEYWDYNFKLADEIDFRELNEAVNHTIEKMPEKMREIFVLSRFENLSAQEISERLNISIQTVRNQISSAIKRFEKIFNDRTAWVIFLYYCFNS